MKNYVMGKFLFSLPFFKNCNFQAALTVALFFPLLICSSNANAKTYYVSTATGDDTRSIAAAQHIETPWRTLSKITAISNTLQPGDSVLFKAGEIYPGTLQVNASGTAGNSIIFSSYGDGALPEITGFTTLNNWQSLGNGIWETTLSAPLGYVNTVTVNDVMKTCGRYPNASAANQGYLNYESFNGNTSISDSKLSAMPNLNGAQVVIRKNRWVLDRNLITSEAGNTLNYTSQSDYTAVKGYGYFIQNSPGTLDADGEWYYQAPGNKFGIYTGSKSPSSYSIKAGTIATLVNIFKQGYLSFIKLRFTGAAVSSFEISNSPNIQIDGCEIMFSGKNAINAYGANNFVLENSLVAYTNNNACKISNCNNNILKSNRIICTGVNAGMGDGDSGSYEGIIITGNNNRIENNNIDSTGYIPINFSGNQVSIKNNFISNFTLVKDDGGGIYTYNNGIAPPVNSARTVSGNIIINGIGAGAGTDNPAQLYANGIYMDDNSGQVDVTNNTISKCTYAGIYIHNAHNINIVQNTVYDNTIQLLMEHDNVAVNSPVANNTVTGNILFAKLATQLSASYHTIDNNINFGFFDNNYYCRPADDDLVINVNQITGGNSINQLLSLSSWQALFGQDANSHKSPRKIPIDTVTNVVGANKYTNGAFTANLSGSYIYSDAGNAVSSWSNAGLDGGCLKVSYSSITNNLNFGTEIIGIGAVTAGKTYRLKFSLIGNNYQKAITAYLRHSLSPYTCISEKISCSITNVRQEKEFLFTASVSEGNASLAFDIPEQLSPMFLDNIKLEEVNATKIDADQYLTFVYDNNIAANSFNIVPGIDVYANKYQNSITLQPFLSSIILKNAVDCVSPPAKPVIQSNP